MTDAKDQFDPLGVKMATLYYEYADFLLKKMEKSVDLFNPNSMPKEGGCDD